MDGSDEILRRASKLVWFPQKGPQEDLLKYRSVPEILFGGARGGGKLLNLQEFLPTPSGYVQLKDLKVGDTLFDENGELCTVLELHPINLSPVSYRVHFDDGSFVDACEEHLWLTYDKNERRALIRRTEEFRAARRAKRPSRAKENPVNRGVQKSVTILNKERKYDYLGIPTGTVRTTKEILESLRLPDGEVNHSIPVTKPIALPHRELSIPPYVLGAWLGDGSRHSGVLTGIDPEIWEEIEKEGFKVTHRVNCPKTHNIVGLSTLLKANNLYLNKHIPMEYLRASKEQRLALLQGLMDTDGTVTDAGCAEFCNTNKKIVDGVYDLICSLGWKARVREGRSKLNGVDKGPKWEIKWTPSEVVFRLPRKAAKQRIAKGWTTKWRYIVAVESIAPVPMRCIKVSSPNSLFLVSRSFIPTHNTAALLGDFVSDVSVYKQHWVGMLFRRTYPELEEVIRQSFEFYPQSGASYNANEKVWKWPNGAKLYLRFMGHPRDAANYQGHQMCLALGEKVLTRTGSKAIEDLRVGDLVMTGSGYHRVLGITAPVDKPCVRVQKSDGTSQVHPVDHEILCDSGWQSYSSLVGITAKEIQDKLRESYTLPSVDALARCVKRVPLVSKLEGQTSNGSCEVCKSSELSRENILTSLRRFVGRFLDRQQQQLQHSQRLDYKSLPTVFDAKNCVPKCFPSPANSQVDCHLSARLHDEQPPLEIGIDQDAFPLPNDAEKPRLNCCSEGVQDNTHICNHAHFSKYPHPYVGRELPMAWENSLEACLFSYVGVKTCVDIHVESVNNYISASTGFLNKNCWLGFDELGNFATDEGFTQMIACLRSPHDVPHKRIRCTANPGGVGHGWVKARYGIAENPMGYKLLEQDTGLHRMFIPSRVTDNQILMKADPTYVQRLHEIGSPEMVRAWLHGDWDVVAGAYFPEFSQEHVIDAIDPDDIPNHWKIYRAYDHGTYHPFAVLWYTYAGEDWRGIKKGSIVILREWYGGNDKDEGLKISLVDIRDGITERESTIKRRIEPGPADNQIFENHGGQSIADALAIAGVYFSRSDKSRIPGWNQIRMRLREKSLLFTRNCKHLLRTFPMLQHDDRRPEDVDTQGADHLADVLRYIAMQWPIIPRFDKKKRRDPNAMTYSDLVEAVDDVSNRWRI